MDGTTRSSRGELTMTITKEQVNEYIKDYLNEYNGEAVKIITKEFASELSRGNITISFR